MKNLPSAITFALLAVCALITTPALAEDNSALAADTRALAVADSLWTSEAAAADSLNRYWDQIDGDWYQPLTPQDIGFGLNAAQLDSLALVGDHEIGRLVSGRIIKKDLDLVGPLVFNRVEGWRPNIALTLRRPGKAPAKLESRFGYGVESRRGVHSHLLELPLMLAEPRSASGVLLERPWPWLTLVANGGREPVRFGGDGFDEYNWTALIGGFDPNHYYQDASWDAKLVLRPRPRWRIEVGGGHHEHKSLPVNTTWNIFGKEEEVLANMAVPELSARALHVGTGFDYGRVSVFGRLGWWRGEDLADPYGGVADGGPRWFRRLRIDAQAMAFTVGGHELELHGAWTSVDRNAPPQWKTWLGDYGTLRGYETGEIAGDSGGFVSADLRWGIDIFNTLRVPLLKDWRLQPISFVDYGRTFVDGDSGPYDHPDWRVDVGFGVGKAIGIPGMGGNLRFYWAKPVGNNQDDEPWRFTVGFEN